MQTMVAVYSNDDLRWEALSQRDRQADNKFLYGVKTTGVCCRPICSSRLPKRENVLFFNNWIEAEEAGFRACKRCTPNATSPEHPQIEAVKRACKLIEESEEPPKLQEIAHAVGLSQFHFHRLFKKITGITPKDYISNQRLRRLQGKLHTGSSVTEAIHESGFGSSSRVYENAGSMLGMAPSKYRKGASGITIRFAVEQSYLGWVLVAATEQGICTIEFGENPESLTAKLRERFPKASLNDNDPEFANWVGKVLTFIETPSHGLNLPLDVQGTAFQQRVWKALQEIPFGATVSYADVAERIGNPSAVRAVAQACASNKIAIAIPCHRVVRSDGNLSGYRWGTERKQTLLEREAAQSQEIVIPASNASDNSGVANSRTNCIETSAFSLVSLAYQGHLSSQGISSYGTLIMAHRKRQISALDLVQTAVKANLLPTDFLENSKYLKAVENGFLFYYLSHPRPEQFL